MPIATPPEFHSFVSSPNTTLPSPPSDATLPSPPSDATLPSPPSSSMATLRRRNSIASVVPTQLDIPVPDARPKSSSFPTGDKPFPPPDFELVSFTFRPLAYTSLKDILPTSSSGGAPSPRAVVPYNCRDISIRNRLVKHAAWAYLQPMAPSSSSSESPFFRRVWASVKGSYFRKPVSACIGFFHRHIFPRIARLFDRLLGAFRTGRKPAVL